MLLTDIITPLCLPSFSAVIGLGLGLLWRASQMARSNGVSWAAALRMLIDSLLRR
ncbi:MAG: hypothetical protein KA764_17600 [Anaerolineales bacterium]|nr:hypothetical protein [Anaerolineales bacterium]